MQEYVVAAEKVLLHTHAHLDNSVNFIYYCNCDVKNQILRLQLCLLQLLKTMRMLRHMKSLHGMDKFILAYKAQRYLRFKRVSSLKFE